MSKSMSFPSISFKKGIYTANSIKMPDIHEESLVIILGRNGSGKSSYIKELIRNHIKNQSITLHGQKLKKTKYSYMSQNYYLNISISVLELLISSINITNKSLIKRENSIEIAKTALQELDILHLANRSCISLSGGETQLVSLCNSIINKPKLLLYDEPTSALDLHYQKKVMDYIKSYLSLNKAYAIIIAHDINIAEQYADFIAIINKGSLYQYGKKNDILHSNNIKNIYQINNSIVCYNNNRHILFHYRERV